VVASVAGEGSTFTLYMPDAQVPDTITSPTMPFVPAPVQIRQPMPAPIDMPLIGSPLMSQRADEEAHVVSPASRQLDGATVLIIDDDVRNVFALTSALEMHGLRVLYSDNGVDGVRLLAEHPEVDIVLMDAMMPDQDGYETTRGIRRNQRFQDLPVVFLTAKAMPGDRESAIAAGASDYITKPVDLDELIELMARWVNSDERDGSETERG
jgi:CheY-like chemotaxis protein